MLLALLIAAPVVLDVQAGSSTLKYEVKHKLHEVSAEAHQMEGKVALLPDGTVQVMVRAKVADFKSGDGNRDEHMQETMESAKFPYVVFKGVGKLAKPAAYPATLPITVKGELDFHGRKKPETVELTAELKSPQAAHATGTLTVSLDAYGVERPSLLLVPINDACVVQLDLQLAEAAH